MRVLYAFQGTGNGHISRANEIVPELKKVFKTDVLISGTESDLNARFEINYKFKGLSYKLGQDGGIDFYRTARAVNPVKTMKEILFFPAKKYDLIINDFEPITALAGKLTGIRCIGLSHQNAVLHPLAPRPSKNDIAGYLILKHYANTKIKFGFHFKSLGPDIFTPVIRNTIRYADVSDLGHYTVYLPAYSNACLEKYLSRFNGIHWEVFSKTTKTPFKNHSGNMSFKPVSNDEFTKSFISCTGILCSAGFETPSEALFMGKKLCVVPIKSQYEQLCNAEFLRTMNITVISELEKSLALLENWIISDIRLKAEYHDNIEEVIRKITSV